MAADPPRFHWADYLTFFLSLLLSVAVGVYYGFIKKQDSTITNYLLGNRNMHVLPVAISLFLSWFSALSFLGDPVEVYYFGAVLWYIGIGYVVGLLPVIFYVTTRFHKLNVLSVNEVSLQMNVTC